MIPEQKLLDNFARRLAQEPDFLSYVLHVYIEQEHIDEQQLAAQLNIDTKELILLATCRTPRPEPEHFGPDLQRISALTGVDTTELARIIRSVATVEALQQAPVSPLTLKPTSAPAPLPQADFLAAARDREAEDNNTTDDAPLEPTQDEEP